MAMQNLRQTPFMHLTLGIEISGMCHFNALKHAEVDFFVTNFDACPELVSELADAKQLANRISVNRLVMPIDRRSGRTKVFPRVVRSISVDVVHLSSGERTSHPQMGQSVSAVVLSVNTDPNVAKAVDSSSYLPRNSKSYSSSGSRNPCKLPRDFVIGKNFFQSGLRKHEPSIG